MGERKNFRESIIGLYSTFQTRQQVVDQVVATLTPIEVEPLYNQLVSIYVHLKDVTVTVWGAAPAADTFKYILDRNDIRSILGKNIPKECTTAAEVEMILGTYLLVKTKLEKVYQYLQKKNDPSAENFLVSF